MEAGGQIEAEDSTIVFRMSFHGRKKIARKVTLREKCKSRFWEEIMR
jgi:hypothetical protein